MTARSPLPNGEREQESCSRVTSTLSFSLSLSFSPLVSFPELRSQLLCYTGTPFVCKRTAARERESKRAKRWRDSFRVEAAGCASLERHSQFPDSRVIVVLSRPSVANLFTERSEGSVLNSFLLKIRRDFLWCLLRRKRNSRQTQQQQHSKRRRQAAAAAAVMIKSRGLKTQRCSCASRA